MPGSCCIVGELPNIHFPFFFLTRLVKCEIKAVYFSVKKHAIVKTDPKLKHKNEACLRMNAVAGWEINLYPMHSCIGMR